MKFLTYKCKNQNDYIDNLEIVDKNESNYNQESGIIKVLLKNKNWEDKNSYEYDYIMLSDKDDKSVLNLSVKDNLLFENGKYYLQFKTNNLESNYYRFYYLTRSNNFNEYCCDHEPRDIWDVKDRNLQQNCQSYSLVLKKGNQKINVSNAKNIFLKGMKVSGEYIQSDTFISQVNEESIVIDKVHTYTGDESIISILKFNKIESVDFWTGIKFNEKVNIWGEKVKDKDDSIKGVVKEILYYPEDNTINPSSLYIVIVPKGNIFIKYIIKSFDTIYSQFQIDGMFIKFHIKNVINESHPTYTWAQEIEVDNITKQDIKYNLLDMSEPFYYKSLVLENCVLLKRNTLEKYELDSIGGEVKNIQKEYENTIVVKDTISNNYYLLDKSTINTNYIVDGYRLNINSYLFSKKVPYCTEDDDIYKIKDIELYSSGTRQQFHKLRLTLTNNNKQNKDINISIVNEMNIVLQNIKYDILKENQSIFYLPDGIYNFDKNINNESINFKLEYYIAGTGWDTIKDINMSLIPFNVQIELPYKYTDNTHITYNFNPNSINIKNRYELLGITINPFIKVKIEDEDECCTIKCIYNEITCDYNLLCEKEDDFDYQAISHSGYLTDLGQDFNVNKEIPADQYFYNASNELKLRIPPPDKEHSIFNMFQNKIFQLFFDTTQFITYKKPNNLIRIPLCTVKDVKPGDTVECTLSVYDKYEKTIKTEGSIMQETKKYTKHIKLYANKFTVIQSESSEKQIYNDETEIITKGNGWETLILEETAMEKCNIEFYIMIEANLFTKELPLLLGGYKIKYPKYCHVINNIVLDSNIQLNYNITNENHNLNGLILSVSEANSLTESLKNLSNITERNTIKDQIECVQQQINQYRYENGTGRIAVNGTTIYCDNFFDCQ